VIVGLDRGALRVEARTMLDLLKGADSAVHAQLRGEILSRKATTLWPAVLMNRRVECHLVSTRRLLN
jgi:hypothetical protein